MQLDLIAQIKTKLESCFNYSEVKVSGDGRHFQAVIVSDDFLNKNRIARHKMVYEALGKSMESEIHALSIKTYTVSEWTNIE